MARRSNLRSARSIANAAIPTRLNIPSSLKNADWVNGTFVYFFDLGVLDEPLSHEDFLQKVRDLAEIYEERLGRRATPWLEVALSRLRKNNFLNYVPYRDDALKFKVTPSFLNVLREAVEHRNMFRTAFDDMPDFKRFRAMCGYLRLRFQRNTPTLTRKQIDMQNIELEHKVTELEDQKMAAEARNRALEDLVAQKENLLEISKRILRMHGIPEGPSSQRASTPAPTEPAVEQHFDDIDSMYVDDVTQTAGPSTVHPPKTPVRRSSTLNNPRAYPTPESAPQRLSPSSSTESPRTPTRTRPSSVEDYSVYVDAEDGMDVDNEHEQGAPSTEPHLETSDPELERTLVLVEQLQKSVQELNEKCQLLTDEVAKRKAEYEKLVGTVTECRNNEKILKFIILLWTGGYRQEKRRSEALENDLTIAKQRIERLQEDKHKLESWIKGLGVRLDSLLATAPLVNTT